ncbi:MAG: PTS lactose/cellobiose transporter subunit IIA [Lachnospiraceae bacterium]|nr:PTS lactose/cellobiose transporter subunit IIA [Lachnospiraceae bacterium]
MDEAINEKLEELAMLIIANSGAARSAAFEALEQAKKGNSESADKLLKSAGESLQEAHEAHRCLLQMDAAGQVPQMSVLLCHAQDHLMGSALAQDLIQEMITLHQALKPPAQGPAQDRGI